MSFSIRFFDATYTEVNPSRDLIFDVQWYNGEAQGGPYQAEVSVAGPYNSQKGLARLLGYYAIIENDYGTPVWWGRADEVTVTAGGTLRGLTLTSMRNRISIAYSATNAAGAPERRTIDWAENAESVSRFGKSELLQTLGDASDAQAIAHQAALLDTLSKPVKIIQPGAGEQPGGLLRLSGLFGGMARQYYTQLSGLESYEETGSGKQPMGLGIVGAANLGFNNDDARVYDIAGRLANFDAGLGVHVSGSASNDGDYVIDVGSSAKAQSYTNTTISFATTDAVNDSAAGFAFVDSYDLIQIVGSTFNDRYAFVDGVATDGASIDISTDGTPLTTESAGDTVTVTKGVGVKMTTGLVREVPGSTINFTAHGYKMAQSFQLAAALNWTAASIAIRIRRVGTPTDNVRVSLCTSGPGAQLDYVEQAGTDMPTSINWVEFALSNTVTIMAGVTYEIVVQRTGSSDPDHYYEVEVNENLGYGRGRLVLWTGSAWVARATHADMPFRVTGAWQTTKQIETIAGEYAPIAGVDIVNASGVYSSQYRDGNGAGLDEMVKLLESGTSDGARLLATITRDRILSVRKKATADPSGDLIYGADNRVRYVSGGEIEKGVLPVGRWLSDEDDFGVDFLGSGQSFFCERAEYNVQDDTYRIEPAGAASPWDLGEPQPG
jgi:hypothetical protein